MEGHLKKPKIAVGGIEHETAGFLLGETPLKDFLNSRFVAKDLLQRSGTSNTVVDGYISGIKTDGRWRHLPGTKLNQVHQLLLRPLKFF